MSPTDKYYELYIELRFSGERKNTLSFLRRFSTKEEADKVCGFYLSAFSDSSIVHCMAFTRAVYKVPVL